MKRTAILTFQYYRILLVYNIAFTIVWIAFALYGFGELNLIILLESYFYFRNAGYRMRRIVLQAFLTDIINFVFAYLLISLIIYAIAHIKS